MTTSPSHCSSIDSATKYTEDCTNLDEDFSLRQLNYRESPASLAVIIALLFPPELKIKKPANSVELFTDGGYTNLAVPIEGLRLTKTTVLEVQRKDEAVCWSFLLTEALYTPLNTARLAAKPPPDLGEQMDSEGEKN